MPKDTSKKLNLAHKIIQNIKDKKIKMRPRSYFILKTILICLGILLIFFLALYFISLFNFAWRANGAWHLTSFGLLGIKLLLPLFLLILLALILFISLGILVKRFSFAYRWPILCSALGILIIILLGSFIIEKTELHSHLRLGAQRNRWPIARNIYQGFGIEKPRDIHRGTITEIKENGFTLLTLENESINVVFKSDTRFPNGKDLQKDEQVIVLGKLNNDTIEALGVCKVNEDFKNLPWPRRHTSFLK